MNPFKLLVCVFLKVLGEKSVIYSLKVLVQIIIMSSSIPNLILVFLKKINLILNFLIFISIRFTHMNLLIKIKFTYKIHIFKNNLLKFKK